MKQDKPSSSLKLRVGLDMQRRGQGFTLIELLVVIAIIGILSAMVLAAVSRAKNSASKATDINNLRQIMIALDNYTSDQNDVLPLANWDAGNAIGDGQAHRGWLYLPDLSATGTNRYNITTGSLWEYLKQPKIYFCPMDKPYTAVYSDHDGVVEEREQQISSYAINGSINGFMHFWLHPEMSYTKLAAMRPTDCAFWETDEREPYYFNDGANNPSEGVSPRHQQGGIQAAFDSSVSYIKLDRWYEEVDETNKNRLWCYPGTPDGRDPND